MGYSLARAIARPILRLREVSQAVAAGHLDQQTGLSGSDEIADLAGAFDTMTLRLRERTAEAAQLYAESLQRNDELAQMNAQLRATQQQLVHSEKMAAIGQLTAGIAHDVRNPLANIKGLAELLAEEPSLNDAAREFLSDIRGNADRANRIIGDLMKFARQSKLELTWADVRATVETVLRLTTYQIRQARVILKTDLPPRPAMALHDPQAIQQVVVNLVQNAIQAMPDGGTLRVAVGQTSDVVAIAVQDTGTGIPPENLGRIFDPFFTTKPAGEGTGLGLSVSYGIVSHHGGRLNVESTVGQGTTFTILLPVHPPETTSGESHA
jgi:two-component system NtrC family sensor kinase